MAVDVVQLLLHVAAEAASVVPVQPLPHNAHAILTLMFVKCKVLNLGGNATSPTRMALFRHYCWRPGCPRYVLTGVRREQGRETHGKEEGLAKVGGSGWTDKGKEEKPGKQIKFMCLLKISDRSPTDSSLKRLLSIFQEFFSVMYLLTGLETSVQAARRRQKMLTWEEIQIHHRPSSTSHHGHRPIQ